MSSRRGGEDTQIASPCNKAKTLLTLNEEILSAQDAEKIASAMSLPDGVSLAELRGARIRDWPEAKGLALAIGEWSDLFLESGEVLRILTGDLEF